MLSKTTEETNLLWLKLFRTIYKYFTYIIQAVLVCKEQDPIRIYFVMRVYCTCSWEVQKPRKLFIYFLEK